MKIYEKSIDKVIRLCYTIYNNEGGIYSMKIMTFTADSLVDVAVAHYIDDYKQKHGKKCTKSYAINALISMGDTMRIMCKNKENA